MFVLLGCNVRVILSKSVLDDVKKKIYFGNITTVLYFDYMMLLVSMWYRFLFRASLRVSVYE